MHDVLTDSNTPARIARSQRLDRRRATLLLAAVLSSFSLARAEETAGVPPTSGDPRIEITSSLASWDNLSELFLGNTPAAAFGDGSVFVMRGELRNKGTQPLHHIVLRYELLDGAGKVLHDAEGYNRAAESMRPDEEGTVRAEQIVPLAPGASDSYRMVFFHDEVPRFASHRVRVVEVHENAPAGGSAKPSVSAPARDAHPAAAPASAAPAVGAAASEGKVSSK